MQVCGLWNDLVCCVSVVSMSSNQRVRGAAQDDF